MDIMEKLQKEWCKEKNGSLKFETLTKGSSIKVWWRCKLGHEWPARFSNRVNGTDCPYCSGRLPISGENDLATLYPDIASEWHPHKNGNLVPVLILPHSNKTVMWKCPSGHEWQAKVNNRTSNGTGCPYCESKLPVVGKTDLLAQYPDIAAQWHPEKNGDLTPENVLPQSNRLVSWICGFGHEWRARIAHRVNGQDCPYCSGQKPIVGETDLATVFPDIAVQWHPTRNGDKHPWQYTSKSHARVWWICDLGHEWESTIVNRSRCGCPVCGGYRIRSGYNDLATLAPEIANEWHYRKNGDILPTEVALHSNTPRYWICEKHHIWKTSPNNRANGTGCPYCNQHRLIPSETSLAVIMPELAAEWNYIKNEPITPNDIPAYCNDRYWWICKYGHEWQAVVSNRSKGDKCPFCVGRKAIPGETDLTTCYPEIAKQWVAERNGEKRPDQYLSMSNERIWWRCEHGHEWFASIASRTTGSGCPICKGRRSNYKTMV